MIFSLARAGVLVEQKFRATIRRMVTDLSGAVDPKKPLPSLTPRRGPRLKLRRVAQGTTFCPAIANSLLRRRDSSASLGWAFGGQPEIDVRLVDQLSREEPSWACLV